MDFPFTKRLISLLNRYFGSHIALMPNWEKIGKLHAFFQACPQVMSSSVEHAINFPVSKAEKEDICNFRRLMLSNIRNFPYLHPLQRLWNLLLRQRSWYIAKIDVPDWILLKTEDAASKRIVWALEVTIETNTYGELYAFVFWIVVDPKFREKGIAQSLYADLDKRLLSRGISYRIAIVHEKNIPAIRTHQDSQEIEREGAFLYLAKRLL